MIKRQEENSWEEEGGLQEWEGKEGNVGGWASEHFNRHGWECLPNHHYVDASEIEVIKTSVCGPESGGKSKHSGVWGRMIIFKSKSVWATQRAPGQPGLQMVSASSVNGNLGYCSVFLWLLPSSVYYSILKPLTSSGIYYDILVPSVALACSELHIPLLEGTTSSELLVTS